MSASGKSSNRLYEYNRGRRTGGGAGIYAAEGRRDRERAQQRRRPHAPCTCPPGDWNCPGGPKAAPTAVPKSKRPAEPVPLTLIGLGVLALHVAGLVARKRKRN